MSPARQPGARATVRQLESFHRDGEALSRMAELLQSCTQRGEAYAIVRETGAHLFPDSSGSLFIYRESRDVLEHVTSWGSGRTRETTLTPDECWALRLGSPLYRENRKGPRPRLREGAPAPRDGSARARPPGAARHGRGRRARRARRLRLRIRPVPTFSEKNQLFAVLS